MGTREWNDVEKNRTFTHYSTTMQMAGMPDMPDNGKYITVYERMKDGSLKIKVETWNTDRQPPMPEHAS